LVAGPKDKTNGCVDWKYEVVTGSARTESWGQEATMTSRKGDKDGAVTLKRQRKRAVQHNRKMFPTECAAAHTPERQAAGTRTSETIPIRPSTFRSGGLQRMVKETVIYHTQEIYDDNEHPSTAAREKTANWQTRGRFMDAITHHRDTHPPKMTHNEKKGLTWSQGKTSGETRQDYEGRVGYGNVCGDVT
jgi:hypothetical protein